MDKKGVNKVLDAIENLGGDITLSHKAPDLMMKKVQNTLEEHTKAFDRIVKLLDP